MQGSPNPGDPVLQLQRQMVRLAEQMGQTYKAVRTLADETMATARALERSHGYVVVPSEAVVGHQFSTLPACLNCGLGVDRVNEHGFCTTCEPSKDVSFVLPGRSSLYDKETMRSLVRLCQNLISADPKGMMTVQVPITEFNMLKAFLRQWQKNGGTLHDIPPRQPLPPEDWRRVQP